MPATNLHADFGRREPLPASGDGCSRRPTSQKYSGTRFEARYRIRMLPPLRRPSKATSDKSLSCLCRHVGRSFRRSTIDSRTPSLSSAMPAGWHSALLRLAGVPRPRNFCSFRMATKLNPFRYGSYHNVRPGKKGPGQAQGSIMWIVKLALNRPYTFVVMALLILIASPVIILRTPTDIFPNIDIPVIAAAWTFTGLNPEEMEGRFTTVFERVLTTTVDNIQHLESTTVKGTAIIKIFLQPNASVDRANAQVTAISQTILRQLPSGALPPLILNYSASTVPILQLALSGDGLSEAQLNDLALNFLRTQLVTVPGASIPFPYGGKQRQVMVNLNPGLLQSKGLSPPDILAAVNSQNLVLPSGTAKIGQFEYDVDLNASPRTVAELN